MASSVATTRELSQRSEQLRVLLVHRTNIPPQFFARRSARWLIEAGRGARQSGGFRRLAVGIACSARLFGLPTPALC